MCIETNLLLHLPLNNFGFYSFVFGATIAQYNLHYLVKKRAVTNSERFSWSSTHKVTHLWLLLFGGLLMTISIFSFHINHFAALGAMAIISILYSLPILPFKKKKRIKDFGLLKIITLALLWTMVTVWFPLVEVKYPAISFQFIFLRRFLFIFILCLMFDVRDRNVDGDAGINTLPVIIGVKNSIKICYILLLVFMSISLIENYYTSDLPELWSMIVSGICTFFIIFFRRKNNNDYYYLAGIDGMMLLQALIVIFCEKFII